MMMMMMMMTIVIIMMWRIFFFFPFLFFLFSKHVIQCVPHLMGKFPLNFKKYFIHVLGLSLGRYWQRTAYRNYPSFLHILGFATHIHTCTTENGVQFMKGLWDGHNDTNCTAAMNGA
jgi:hypothetical protein